MGAVVEIVMEMKVWTQPALTHTRTEQSRQGTKIGKLDLHFHIRPQLFTIQFQTSTLVSRFIPHQKCIFAFSIVLEGDGEQLFVSQRGQFMVVGRFVVGWLI